MLLTQLEWNSIWHLIFNLPYDNVTKFISWWVGWSLGHSVQGHNHILGDFNCKFRFNFQVVLTFCFSLVFKSVSFLRLSFLLQSCKKLQALQACLWNQNEEIEES